MSIFKNFMFMLAFVLSFSVFASAQLIPTRNNRSSATVGINNVNAPVPDPLLKGKKATILTASGGAYAEGTPAGSFNFADPYLKTVLGFLGVTEVTVIAAGGAAQVMMGSVDRDTFLKPHLEQVRTVAA